ncbi:hypothetical protein L195_g026445 [Trifolium pratense]|uniref:Aminotransferase-like plant mobile domain-containing protein n=1 Tax=Trifolium pratense TaxID=57577 RepID=A0A2K3NJ96_TRIPR|nr:hypothetical protein L195_g026445 [Trifolium pratense]
MIVVYQGERDRVYQDYAVRTYLLFLVGTTIFSSKVKNYVDVTFLQYFQDLEIVGTYAWALAPLAFQYWDLSSVAIQKTKYLADHLTLLHITIFNIGVQDVATWLGGAIDLKVRVTTSCSPMSLAFSRPLGLGSWRSCRSFRRRSVLVILWFHFCVRSLSFTVTSFIGAVSGGFRRRLILSQLVGGWQRFDGAGGDEGVLWWFLCIWLTSSTSVLTVWRRGELRAETYLPRAITFDSKLVSSGQFYGSVDVFSGGLETESVSLTSLASLCPSCAET